MNNDSHCAEIYRPYQKKKGHVGLLNSKNGETVLLSDFEQLCKYIKKDSYEDDISNRLIEKCTMFLKDNVVDLF